MRLNLEKRGEIGKIGGLGVISSSIYGGFNHGLVAPRLYWGFSFTHPFCGVSSR